VEHELHACACVVTGVQIADVSLDESVPLPEFLPNAAPYVIEVLPLARREIVQADHVLAEQQQLLDEMRADEASASGHQPPKALAGERVPRRFGEVQAHGAWRLNRSAWAVPTLPAWVVATVREIERDRTAWIMPTVREIAGQLPGG
jgi:hypothetical protein